MFQRKDLSIAKDLSPEQERASTFSSKSSIDSFRRDEGQILAQMHTGEISIADGQKVIAAMEKRQYSYGSLYEIPAFQKFQTASLQQLESHREDIHQNIISQSHEVKTRLLNLGFSGRGELDLERIMTRRQGSYGFTTDGTPIGRIMAFGAMDRTELTPHGIASLEVAAYKAHTYACWNTPERTKVDPNPGGIILLNSKNAMLEAVSPTDGWPPGVGHTTMRLDPSNFGEVVEGAVSYYRSENLHISEKTLRKKYTDILYNSPDASEDYKRDTHNDLAPRIELNKRFIGLSILMDALKLFT